ncbi:MAG: hypothetical protein J5I90_16515 [Caldilineales bacterium]|nr:hypothetical protein [Caldilineales bacterium]
MSTYLNLMGWNEILARLFDGFECQRDVSPEWLINPGTRRRLKLDLMYPEIGVAVRFTGMQVKGIGRKSDWEELEDASRDEVRKALCRENGIELFLLSPNDGYPSEQFKGLSSVLAGASRRIAQGPRFQGKAAVMEKLSNARERLEDIRRRVKRQDDLVPYAEAWRDRETRMVAELSKPTPHTNGKSKGKAKLPKFEVGQQVEHQSFGPGVITQVDPREDDTYLTIRFVTAGEKRFAGSLAVDKLAASHQ